MSKNNSYPTVIWLLAIGMAINVTGNSFLWPLNTIYITEVLGKTVSIAGFVLMLQQASAVMGSFIGGWLFDRWGSRRTILIGTAVSIVTVFFMGFFKDLNIYIGLMLILGFSNGLVFPSMYAMAGAVWPEGGRKAFNIIYVFQNLGVALGASIGGVVAQFSFQSIFLFNSLTFVLFLMWIQLGIKKKYWEMTKTQPTKQTEAINSERVTKSYIKNYIALAMLSFAFILNWMPYVQWQTSLSIYIKDLGIPFSMYTLLWTINGSLIVLGQPLISLITNKLLTTIKKQIGVGVVLFILAFAILYNNELYFGFVLAMVIMTFGEMLVWPAVPAAANELAPEGKKGFYQGAVSSSGAAGRMLGFLVGGWLFDNTEINNIIIIMLVLFIISGISYLNYDRVMRKAKMEYAAKV